MLKGGDLPTLRSCVKNALDETTTDNELRTELTKCMNEFSNPMQRQDTEQYNPDSEMNGGKKSRRHHRKSRHTRRKIHKRKTHKRKH